MIAASARYQNWLLLVVVALSTGPPATALAGGGQLRLSVVDRETGQPIPCRMHLKNAAGKPRPVKGAPFWHDHFVFAGEITLRLPRGDYTFEIERGPEYTTQSGHFTIEDHADDTKTVELKRAVNMAREGWWSGDLDVHRPVRDLEQLMAADDLHVALVVSWSKRDQEKAKTKNLSDQRPLTLPSPARGEGSRIGARENAALATPDEPLVRFDENRFYDLRAGEDERAGNDLLYFEWARPPLGEQMPAPLELLLAARREPAVWVDAARPCSWDLPLWLALGLVDSIDLANRHLGRDRAIAREAGGKPRDAKQLRGAWGNALWSQQIYYQLLNCGLRLPPSAGSGSGESTNPLGYNRVYIQAGPELDYAAWWQAFRAGRVLVTNGPLLRPIVAGKFPGHVFQAAAGAEVSLDVNLNLATRDPVSYLEIIKNGQVERAVRLDEWAKTGTLSALKFTESGWFLIRSVTDVESTYRFASTGPYYVEIGDQPKRVSRTSAQFFLDWLNERLAQLSAGGQLSEGDRRHFEQAQRFWQGLVAGANAE